jgi:hypothetical protein
MSLARTAAAVHVPPSRLRISEAADDPLDYALALALWSLSLGSELTGGR